MIAVRHASNADADAAARLHHAAWQEAYAGLLPPELLASRTLARRREQWSEWLDTKDAEEGALVAEFDREVVGVAVFECRPSDDPELRLLYVHPSRWRLGVGRALIDAVLRELRLRGATSAVVWTFSNNKRARAFYESLGWSLDGREGDSEGVPTVQYRVSR